MGFTIMESFMDKLRVRSSPGRGHHGDDGARHARRDGDAQMTEDDHRVPALGQGRRQGRRRSAWSRRTPASSGAWPGATSAAAWIPRTSISSAAWASSRPSRAMTRATARQFSTYAVPKISGEIRRFLRDDGAVKVSRGVKERAAAHPLGPARRLSRGWAGSPPCRELSAETGLTPEDIAVAETATGPAESLQRESGEDGFTLEQVLGDYGQEERAGRAGLPARGYRRPARAGAPGHRPALFPRHDPGRRRAGHRRFAGAGLAA